MMYRLAFGILRDAQSAEDACQQSLMRLWEKRNNMKDPSALRGYLARTVVNESLAVRRRRDVEQRAAVELRHRTTTQRTILERLADRELVLSALDRLEEPRRTIVAMRVIDGMAGTEVAQALRRSPSEISRYLHEGLDRMRSHIRELDSSSIREHADG